MADPNASTLSDEHSLLLREVTTRAEALLREADEGRWPEPQLRALIDYLHLEVLQQVIDEEWLVFRSGQYARAELARLRGDHVDLRLTIEVMAQALGGKGTLTPKELAACTRDLVAQLKAHLIDEEQVLTTAGASIPPTTDFGARPHEWYALTAGPVIELDQLPGVPGFDAVLDRILRMTPGEQIELRATSDPGPIWQRLTTIDAGGYGCVILESSAGQWRVQVSRWATP